MDKNKSGFFVSIIFRRFRISSDFFCAKPFVDLLDKSSSFSLVKYTSAPDCCKYCCSFLLISKVISFSCVLSEPTAPPSTPPCPGSSTIVLPESGKDQVVQAGSVCFTGCCIKVINNPKPTTHKNICLICCFI